MDDLVVDDAELVEEPLPGEQRKEAGHRPRDDQDRAVRAQEAHPLLVERDREEKPDRK